MPHGVPYLLLNNAGTFWDLNLFLISGLTSVTGVYERDFLLPEFNIKTIFRLAHWNLLLCWNGCAWPVVRRYRASPTVTGPRRQENTWRKLSRVLSCHTCPSGQLKFSCSCPHFFLSKKKCICCRRRDALSFVRTSKQLNVFSWNLALGCFTNIRLYDPVSVEIGQQQRTLTKPYRRLRAHLERNFLGVYRRKKFPTVVVERKVSRIPRRSNKTGLSAVWARNPATAEQILIILFYSPKRSIRGLKM